MPKIRYGRRLVILRSHLAEPVGVLDLGNHHQIQGRTTNPIHSKNFKKG